MNARACLAFAAAMPLLLLASEAKADEEDAHAFFERTHPVRFRSGFTYSSASHEGLELQHADAFVGIGYDWSRLLSLHADLHYGTTRFAYKSSLDDSLAVDGRFSTPLDVSGSSGLTLHLMRQKPFWADFETEFESSLFNSAPKISSLSITTPQGVFDVAPYAQRQTTLSTSWYRLRVGTVFGARFGPVEPQLGLAFEYVHAAMDVKLNADSRDSLSMLGHDSGMVENPHSAGFFHVLLTPGVDLHLGKRDAIGIGGSFAPGASIDSFGGQLLFRHRF